MPKQAKDLAAFLSDWSKSKNSVLIKAVAAAEETDDSSKQSRQRSHSQPPPATPHLPTGGTFLRRRNSFTMNRGSDNSDDTNQIDTIDSVMTTRRRSPSHSLQNQNISNHNYRPQIDDDDTTFNSSPLCTLALVDERLNISRRFREAGAGVGGGLPPLPLSLLETRSNDNEDTQQPSSILSTNHIVLSNPSTGMGMDSNHSDIDEEPNSARSNAHSDGQEHDGNDNDRAS